ncbi:MAG TPA: YbaK/EbsC family protein, partial [Leptolinea sp.]
LRDKKGIQHYLVILKIETPINLAGLAKQLKCGCLSFASDKRLYKYLGTQPGAVSPFGLMHDTGHEVKVILDNAILDSDKAGFHPNVNTATLVIAVLDLFHFLEMNGNSYQVVDFSKEVYL